MNYQPVYGSVGTIQTTPAMTESLWRWQRYTASDHLWNKRPGRGATTEKRPHQYAWWSTDVYHKKKKRRLTEFIRVGVSWS